MRRPGRESDEGEEGQGKPVAQPTVVAKALTFALPVRALAWCSGGPCSGLRMMAGPM